MSGVFSAPPSESWRVERQRPPVGNLRRLRHPAPARPPERTTGERFLRRRGWSAQSDRTTDATGRKIIHPPADVADEQAGGQRAAAPPQPIATYTWLLSDSQPATTDQARILDRQRLRPR